MAAEAGTFNDQFCGFVGPARAIIDRDETGEIILPPTQGDATVTMDEETYEVNFDERGNTPVEVFSVGQRLEVEYPMKYANLEAMVLTLTGDNYTLSDTAAPGGTDGSGHALVARKTAEQSFNYPHKKTVYTFDIWRLAEPSFTSAGDAVTRTEDYDLFGMHIPNAVITAPTGEAFSFHNEETVYTMHVLGTIPIASSDPLYRMFNIDLDKAS